jgi:hypothetical protein
MAQGSINSQCEARLDTEIHPALLATGRQLGPRTLFVAGECAQRYLNIYAFLRLYDIAALHNSVAFSP